MRLTAVYSFFVVLLCSLSSAQETAREIRRSPDGRYFIAWFDYDAGAPIGLIRPVVVRNVSDPFDIFSFVSVPRYTDAAWNPASTQCVIADAPDNGGPKTWLVYQKTPQEWATRGLEPFVTLYEAFRKTDPEVRHLFRPSILKITWLSDWNGAARNMEAIGIIRLSSTWRGGCVRPCLCISTLLRRSCMVERSRRRDRTEKCLWRGSVQRA